MEVHFLRRNHFFAFLKETVLAE